MATKLGDHATYILFGVVHHRGKLGAGHYVADVQHRDKWFQVDDDSYEEIGQPNFNSTTAYLLFYARR